MTLTLEYQYGSYNGFKLAPAIAATSLNLTMATTQGGWSGVGLSELVLFGCKTAGNTFFFSVTW